MNKQQNPKQKPIINQSDHSLGPDLFTGWQSKTLVPKLKQFPLYFAHQTTDHISKTLTSFGSELPYKVIYMGFRPSSNMKVFKQYGQNKNNKIINQSILYGKKPIKRFKFHHFDQAEKYFPIRPSQYRLFTGLNPTWKNNQDIKFSSDFQGGNLDLAINVNQNEYDLLMRVDSNTKGHTSWYFFKVYNIKKKKKVKFNIINYNKNNGLYLQGMKPYVFRTSKPVWTQQGTSEVQFKNRAIRYFGQKQQPKVSKCLTFSYEFNDPSQEVYFAYSIPYSYSYLLDVLDELQKKYSQFVKINYENETTGGLPLPVVTITNFTKQTDKKCCLAIGRLHPGQAQGSWMMDGFMKYICSPQAHYLRNKMQFKIIPMVNIDGVVIGNFRTGINGRDLNRVFNNESKFHEIKLIKKLASQLNPQIFLDFHGHSGRKNVFIYGPQYKIQDKNYLTSRLYPKIISKKTQAFRYYSCVFKISQSKLNTGRAILFNEFKTRFVFTIEASTHGFGSMKEFTHFDAQKYISVGIKLAQSLEDFVRILNKLPKRLQQKLGQQQKKLLQKKTSKQKLLDGSAQMLSSMDIQNYKMQDFFNQINQSDQCMSQYQLQKQLLKQILQCEKQIQKQYKQCKTTKSDSDCQQQNQDYTDLQLQKINKNGKLSAQDTRGKRLKKSKSKIQGDHLKNAIKLKQKFLDKKNYNTVEMIQNKESLLLSRQILKKRQIHVQRNKAQSSFDYQIVQKQKNFIEQKRNQLKKQYSSSMMMYQKDKESDKQSDQIDKLRKLNAWKSNQLKKLFVTQQKQLQRNKSLNYVNLQSPPENKQALHSKLPLPKTRLQHKKNEPILLIRKSFLPTLQLKSNNSKKTIFDSMNVNDPQTQKTRQKSIISEILNMHERKKRKNRSNNINMKMRIYHDQ